MSELTSTGTTNFNHIDIELPKLSRETIDGVRYYSVPDEEELLKLVSITSVTSHFNKDIFVKWRKELVMKKQIVSRSVLQNVVLICILWLNIT